MFIECLYSIENKRWIIFSYVTFNVLVMVIT